MLTSVQRPGDYHARPRIHTAADLDLWLDGFDAGAAVTLRTLASMPADKLPAVIAAMIANRENSPASHET